MYVDEEEGVFVAGHEVPAGCYIRVDVPGGRRVELAKSGRLPVSFDGTVAIYRRLSMPRLDSLGQKTTMVHRRIEID